MVRRSGTVAIVGRSNVGKSTLLNAALRQDLAIVSNKPQTTRTALLGIVRHGEAEIGFLDTPGLHRAQSLLGREMNRAAKGALRDADAVAFVAAVPRRSAQANRTAPDGSSPAPHPGDRRLIAKLPADKPVVLVLNKVDLIRDKRALLPLIAGYAAVRPFAAIVPISALAQDGVAQVLDELALLMPEQRARYPRDALTDQPARRLAADYVREAILGATAQEVPHAVAVTIDEYLEPADEGGVTRIAATIHVERAGQKRILIGEKGAMMKRIGSAARQRIEQQLSGGRTHLDLWVRVSEGWRDRPDLLADFGLLARGA